MESKPVYKAGEEEPEPVRCECGAQIGHYTTGPDGKTWLSINGMVLDMARGVCSVCGEKWHWTVSDKQLEALIKRMVENRRRMEADAKST